MAKSFRNIIRGILPNRSWKKYLKYALGEISLLVVGILIALQINNWNENRIHNNQLNEILRTVESDLIRDTVTVSRIIEFYEVVDTLAEKFIQKKVTPEYYKNCMYCSGLGVMYLPFHANKKGYLLLEKFTVLSSNKDTVADEIVKFYTQFLNLMDVSNEYVNKTVQKNIDDYEKYDWYVDWTLGKTSDEMIDYYCNSEDYRKKMATFKIYAIKNHLAILKQYKASVKIGLKKLKKRLE